MRFNIEEVTKLTVNACIVFIIAYTLFWFVVGFGSSAPGDFPWEDVFPSPISNAFYYVSYCFEEARDLLLGGW
jgi:hypothetical protein